MNTRLAALLAVLLLASSCTIIKPVACAIVYPAVSVVRLFEGADRKSEPESKYEDIPTGLALVELTILLPVFYAYKTTVGLLGGLFTGFVSDLNIVTGNANLKGSYETILDPARVNQRRVR
jgi:hypothetical protein